MTPFTTRRRVEFCDTDMAGMMHFANFFRFMEFAEHEFLRSRGLTVIWEEDGGRLGFPRVSATCDYLQPAHYFDELDIAVTIERIGEKSVSYGFEFRRGAEVIARGKITTVCCRVGPDGKVDSIAIPEPYRARLN